MSNIWLCARIMKSLYNGELTSFNLEHLIDDLFKLRDNFKTLGMIIKDGQVYLPDLEEDGNV